MEQCPVCGKATQGRMVCPVCGFDSSADREQYPTLIYTQKERVSRSGYAQAKMERKGGCGVNAQWCLHPDGLLEIEGSGAMQDYAAKDELSEAFAGVFGGLFSDLKRTEAPWTVFQDDIRRVVVEADITAIGENAFADCANLQTVQLPDTLQTIGKHAFSRCTSLTEVQLSDFMSEIAWGAFSGCGALETVTLPQKLQKLGGFAFWNCSKLREIVLPERLKKIEENTFDGCRALKTVRIPAGVQEIGKHAFENCTALRQVILKPGLQCIREKAFAGCKALREIQIPATVYQIATDAFADCREEVRQAAHKASTENPLERVKKLNDTLGQMGKNAQTAGYVIRDGVLESYTGTEKVLRIPQWVQKIGRKALAYNENLTEVILPNGLTCIEKDAFAGCWNLKYASIPLEVTEIGESAFYNCTSLKRVDLLGGRTLKKIGALAFAGCTALEEVELPGDLIEIPEYAFGQCENLQHVEFSYPEDEEKSCTRKIAKGAFKGCSKLTGFEIPYTVKEIEEEAFLGCKALQSVVLPTGVKLGKNVFEPSCALQKEYEIENGVLLAYRGYDAYAKVPEGVTLIAENAFAASRERLLIVDVPEGVRAIGAGAFENCTKLEFIELPKSLRSIGERAFAGCTSLECFNSDAAGLEEIGRYAFRNCTKLDAVELHSDRLQSVAADAFEGCTKLESIEFPAKVQNAVRPVLRGNSKVSLRPQPDKA